MTVLALTAVALATTSLLAPGWAAGATSTVPPINVTAELSAEALSPPTITSTSALVIDADSGQVLFAKEPDRRLPMASTTKIMTAIVVLESLQLDAKVMVSRNAHFQAGSLVGLHALDVVTVEQLLYWMLVFSGNDAAVALAEETAGSVGQFVVKMNEKAQAMGLANTHFVNPNGLDRTDHYSSCADLATMARYAMKNETFRTIVKTPVYDLPHPGTYTPAEPTNSNALLTLYDWVTGIKTGSTPTAGYCLVASGTQDGVSLIVVELGTKDDVTRWSEAEILFDYGFGLSPTTALAQPGQALAEVNVGDPLGQTVQLAPKDQLVTRIRRGETAMGNITLTHALTLPIQEGDVLGSAEFTLDGRSLGTTNVIALAPVQIPTVRDMLVHARHWYYPEFQPSGG